MKHDYTIPARLYTYQVPSVPIDPQQQPPQEFTVPVAGFSPDELSLEVAGGSEPTAKGTVTFSIFVQSAAGVHSGLTEARVEIVVPDAKVSNPQFTWPAGVSGGPVRGVPHGGSMVWDLQTMPLAQGAYAFSVDFEPANAGLHRVAGVVTAHELKEPMESTVDLQVTSPPPSSGASS
jgi:hypothetical protein